MRLSPLNNGPVEKSSCHGCYPLGPQEVELEHSKGVVSWLLSFHGLFRLPPVIFCLARLFLKNSLKRFLGHTGNREIGDSLTVSACVTAKGNGFLDLEIGKLGFGPLSGALRLLNALNSEDRGLKVRFSLATIVFETFELILCQMLSSQGKTHLQTPILTI